MCTTERIGMSLGCKCGVHKRNSGAVPLPQISDGVVHITVVLQNVHIGTAHCVTKMTGSGEMV